MRWFDVFDGPGCNIAWNFYWGILINNRGKVANMTFTLKRCPREWAAIHGEKSKRSHW